MPRQHSIFDFSRPKKRSFVDLTGDDPPTRDTTPTSGASSPQPELLQEVESLYGSSLVDSAIKKNVNEARLEYEVANLGSSGSSVDCSLGGRIEEMCHDNDTKESKIVCSVTKLDELDKKRTFDRVKQEEQQNQSERRWLDQTEANFKQKYSKFEVKQEFEGTFQEFKKESTQLSIEDKVGIDVSNDVNEAEDFSDLIKHIPCPICSLNIAKLLLDLRTIHVENCLVPPRPEKRPLSGKPTSEKPIVPLKRKPNTGKYINGAARKSDIETRSTKLPTTIKRGKVTRPIPGLKRLAFGDLEVTVDAFSFANDPSILHYFLTHFHSDHYGGISKNWCFERVFPLDVIEDHSYKRIIYCTPITSRLLTIRFSIDPRFIQELAFDQEFQITSTLYVTPLTANHCPGAAIFLYRYVENGNSLYTLHCGDFRVNSVVLNKLKCFHINTGTLKLERVYLDTTYCKPIYNFPKQETVCSEVLQMFDTLINDDDMFTEWFGALKQHRITDFFKEKKKPKKRFLILVGTYLIGKENLAIAILKRLKCKIYISTVNSRDDKSMIIQAYHDAYLDLVLSTSDIGEMDESHALIHLVPMKIAGNLEEMCKYFNHNNYFETFERCVGIRPTGWSFPVDRTKIHEDFGQLQLYEMMKAVPKFDYRSNILPQGPKTSSSAKTKQDSLLYRIYLLPYSEHSLFRELSYFCAFLDMKRVIPTVNTHNDQSVVQMDRLIETWAYARERIRRGEMQITIDDF